LLLPFLHRIAARQHLSADQAREAMLVIFGGHATTPQITAFLAALATKGETADELLGFARAMREMVTRVEPRLNGEALLDTCGTGGGDCVTFNISTIAAFVAAGAGACVAKHGNRSHSTPCGSADILEELGVHIATEPQQMARSIEQVGIGFLFAPALHPAMKHAQSARAELKMRTVFNLLGPLSNPAGARRQLIGAPSTTAAELMAQALTGLDMEHAFVVHGDSGLDEISTTGPTRVFEVKGTQLRQLEWTPEEFGVSRADIESLRGGTRAENRRIALHVLEGGKGPARNIVLVNAAAALMAHAGSQDKLEAMERAVKSIDSGAAFKKVRQLADLAG
jgi:anthranilate phosphoribosyltransferase